MSFKTMPYKTMQFNLAQLPQLEMDKINVDLAAAAVAFKERYKISVLPEAIERDQPQELRDWFRQRLAMHRQRSAQLDCLPMEQRDK